MTTLEIQVSEKQMFNILTKCKHLISATRKNIAQN